jgi:Helix-turn-helix domain
MDLDAKETNELEARTIGQLLELYLKVNAHPSNPGGLAPSTYERYESLIGLHMLDKLRRRGFGMVQPQSYAVAFCSIPAVRFNEPQAPAGWREQMLCEGVPKATRKQAWRGCSQPVVATLHDRVRDEGVAVAKKRREYSVAERRELWERWERGESYADIARALDRVSATIYCTIRQQGGVAPRERRRSRLALTFAEREGISRGIAAGRSARRIAATLGRAPSTVTREIDRHGGRSSYRAAEADERAWQYARRPQVCKLARDRTLRQLVASKLAADWSPEQIVGWLKAEFPSDQIMRVSHETIYLTLFIQARGALKQELVLHLRRQALSAPASGQQAKPRPGPDHRRGLDPRAPG